MKINPKDFRSQLESIKDLEQRNKVFDVLSDEKKRREIAFDCLQLTLALKVTGSDYRNSAPYWGNELNSINTKTPREFQEILVNELPECEVCVRGGLMLSQIRLGNNISTDDDFRNDGNERNIRGFSLEKFITMEEEYEQEVYGHPYKMKTTEKLQNICLNVIANGDFDQEDKTDYLVEYLKK